MNLVLRPEWLLLNRVLRNTFVSAQRSRAAVSGKETTAAGACRMRDFISLFLCQIRLFIHAARFATPERLRVLAVLVLAGSLANQSPATMADGNCPMLPPSDQTDSDNDGIGDLCDNCMDTANTSQQDTDADGYGNFCDPDFDNNLNVDFADLAFMKSAFFGTDPVADLNGDGAVDFADLAILKSGFFSAPGPTGMVPDPDNQRPVAEAGPDQIVATGRIVPLDGSGSADPDGDSLTYWWSLVSAPAASTATLADALTVNPVFQVDIPGSYNIRLVVIDGATMSEPDTITISAPEAGDKTGFIGDSMTMATHTDDMCEDRSIIGCIANKLGAHDPAWSHGTGSASWSLGNLLGYAPENVINAAGDGERWQDALAQASQIMAVPDVNSVIINLGANDVCQGGNHDYAGDLATIGEQVDNVLTYLTDRLPGGGFVGMVSVPDILTMRQVMVDRDHNHLFESCQATWDLDKKRVKDSAALDACIELFGSIACDLLERTEVVIEVLVEQFLDYYAGEYGIREGICGKALSSDATDQDRAEVARFNLDLNQLLESRADQYNGRNGVQVNFNWNVYDQSASIKPFHISRVDCYHPSRAGQMWLAMLIRQGWEPAYAPTARVFHDGLDSKDYCLQEFTTWPGCWLDPQDGDPQSGDIQITEGKLMVRDNDTLVSRPFDLSGQSAAWLQIMHRRDDVSDNQNVWAQISSNGGATWTTIADYNDGDEKGDHRGHYYDLSAFPFGPDMWLRFQSSRNLGSNEKVLFDNIKIFSW